MIRYKIKLKNTAATIGYFQPEPEGIEDLEKGISLLSKNRFDDFLRNYLLSLYSKMEFEKRKAFIEKAVLDNSDAVKAFAAEAIHISPDLSIEDYNLDINSLKDHTSLIYLNSIDMEKRDDHKTIATSAFNNINNHTFPESEFPEIEPEEDKVVFSKNISEFEINKSEVQEQTFDIFNHALNRFEKAGLIPGNEMRHFTALSPEAILRKWYMKTIIKTGDSDFSFEGIQTSYGKGETLDLARISCLMEVAERISSFVSVDDLEITNRKNDKDLIYSSYSEGVNKGLNFLDPNSLRLEIPYKDWPMYWMKAKEAINEDEYKDIYIPVQTSYLFVNLPEQSLFSSLDSTGLATGDTPHRAKLKGVFEALERDSEYSMPFTMDSCFRLKSRTPEINALFEFYKSRGIDFFFQDITSEFGVPVFKAFVYGPDNVIYKGCSCHLNGKKAAIDALFEVPYPTMNNPASKKIEFDLPEKYIEDIPDYSTGSIKGDLKLLKTFLIENNLKPIFSEITRPDLDIPVFRTIIPGLEINGDFDEYYRISKRQYKNFKNIFKIKADN
jgi:ribosomal protein S12 methylthiotransferase accessory factor YcaO